MSREDDMQNASIPRQSNKSDDKSDSKSENKSDDKSKDDKKEDKKDNKSDDKKSDKKDSDGDKKDDKSGDKKDDDSSKNDKKDDGDEAKLGKKNDKKSDNPLANMKKAKKNAKNVKRGLKAAMSLKIAQMLTTAATAVKNFFAMAMLVIQGMIQAIIQAIVAAVMAVVNAIMAVVGAIATVIGTTLAVAGFIVVCVGFVLFGGLVAVVDTVVEQQAVARNDAISTITNCAITVRSAVDDSAVTDVDAEAEKVAKKMFSFYKELYKGQDDIEMHIAGIFGNLSHESNFDPTAVEGIFNEPHTMGSLKTAAQNVDFDPNKYKIANGSTLTEDYAKAGIDFSNVKRSGIGLIAWTAENNEALCNYAKSKNKNWYDIDVQLAFSVGSDWGKPLDTWLRTEKVTSPEAASDWFLINIERPTNIDQTKDERQKSAASWYAKMADWAVDATYANSVIELANAAKDEASGNGVSKARDECNNNGLLWYDNRSLAKAAVSFAWPKESQGAGNNGTELYIKVHDAVMPGDTVYPSCDRTVAAAVRWSGLDDNYPMGNPTTQYDYCLSHSDKWRQIDWKNKADNLQPGDIFIKPTSGQQHTFIYVGHDIINEVYGADADSTANIVSGSYTDRSPGCGTQNLSNVDSDYVVFRNIKPDANSKYSKLSLTKDSQK